MSVYGWVLQSGGPSDERARLNSLDVAQNNDVYSAGVMLSQVLYFDPLVVDSHSDVSGGDLFIAKLRTSKELLRSCKVDESTVAQDFYSVSNVCYQSGAPSKGKLKAACMKCSPKNSQMSLTRMDSYCFIDGACYAHGSSGWPCQYCDVAHSAESWSIRDNNFVARDMCLKSTWTTQIPTLPNYNWVVMDNGDGFSYSAGAAVTADAVLVWCEHAYW